MFTTCNIREWRVLHALRKNNIACVSDGIGDWYSVGLLLKSYECVRLLDGKLLTKTGSRLRLIAEKDMSSLMYVTDLDIVQARRYVVKQRETSKLTGNMRESEMLFANPEWPLN